jgi:hypothetical protein
MALRRKRNVRDSAPPPMELTGRDMQIIEAVYQYRLLRQDQLHTLFFGASKAASQRRLALLYHHGFLDRTFLSVRASYLLSPAIYLIDKRGIELLRGELGYEIARWQSEDKRIGQQFLEHTLAVNDVRVAITLAARQLGYELLTWKSEAELKVDFDRVPLKDAFGKKQAVSLIPDGYFVLDTPLGKAHFFLELDRGTMTTKRFAAKIAAYTTYYRSGAYEQRYKTRSLRVLTVTLSEGRLVHLKKAAETVGADARFWFATHAQVTVQQVLSRSIWQIAGNEASMPLIAPSS